MIDTPKFRALVRKYLKLAVTQFAGTGWQKGEVHEEIVAAIAKELKIDKDMNFQLISIWTREALTNDMTTIGFRFRRYEEKELTPIVARFVKEIEKMLPDIAERSYEKTDKWIGQQEIWRHFRGPNGVGVKGGTKE